MVSKVEELITSENSRHAVDENVPYDYDIEANTTKNSSDTESISNDSCPSFLCCPSMTMLFSVLILLLGGAASAAFIAIGITALDQAQAGLFDSRSMEIATSLETSWQSYEVAGLHVHEAARSRNISRREFRELYEYLISSGIVFQVTSFNPNVTNAERSALEEESRQFYADNYPDLVPDYRGIVGLEPNDPTNSSAGTSVQPRSEQAFYFPVHLLEPIEGNVGAVDFDLYSTPSRRETIHLALETWLPALTPRLHLVQETDPNAYSVILMHPGVPLSTTPNLQPRDFSSVVIRIPDLLRDAVKFHADPTTVFLFDSTDKTLPNAFLGGASTTRDNQLIFEKEVTLEGVRQRFAHQRQKEIIMDIASSKWALVVVDVEGTYQADSQFIILGGTIIMAACVILAVWLATAMRQLRIQSNLKQRAETERAEMIVKNAERLAQSERELNDFIAHEVRNPLSAAMSACTFVSSSLTEEIQPLVDDSQSKKNLESALEDTRIISSSLQFINDLLRNMLDMHRASANQLSIDMSPTDIWHDVFMPVEAMLYSRGRNFEVRTECPDKLVVLTDRLRLKQIALNLARNSVKFVEKGFVRLRAAVVDNKVHIYIEDSGPGIPEGKRDQLFAKFQKSLDSLNQGTGIGLSLCLDLATLMGAEIRYDESYDSGIPGCPGARFVINLNVPPLQFDDHDFGLLADGNDHSSGLHVIPKASSPDAMIHESGINNGTATNGSSVPLEENISNARSELPEKLNVLFCDDDLVLRKLFCRGLRQVAPGWHVSEASNGESVLRMLDDADDDKQLYDIIFMDQYMASVDKQLLGTETVVAIRAKGVKSIICGLSANDTEQAFLDAGANAFMMKPFPCEKNVLAMELLRVIQSGAPLPSKG